MDFISFHTNFISSHVNLVILIVSILCQNLLTSDDQSRLIFRLWSLSFQYFQAMVAGETCGTVTGDPIDPATVEPYLWWPNTVGKATPTLLETMTNVAVLAGVCVCVCVCVCVLCVRMQL